MRFSRCSKTGASSSLFRFPGPVSADEANDPESVQAQSQGTTSKSTVQGIEGRPQDTKHSLTENKGR